MRVLVFNHSCVVDVNQRIFDELQKQLGAEVLIISPAAWLSSFTKKMMTPSELAGGGFTMARTPVFLPGNINLHFYKRLPWNQIRQFKPDIVLSWQEPFSLSGAQAMGVARRLHVPFVFFTEQNILKSYPLPFALLEKSAFRNAAIALSCAEESRQVMIQKGLTQPSAVLPLATDVEMFAPGTAPDLREQLHLTGHIVIGNMGRQVSAKGIDTLIDAARILKADASLPPFKVLLVGSGDAQEALRAQVASGPLEDVVVFAGSVPHNQASLYFNAMDIFVLPSKTTSAWKEQFGRVIIEALASEVPVVGSDSGEIPHLIRATGGGLVFPEGDAAALAQRLKTLIIDPTLRKQYAQTGREAAYSRYSLSAVTEQLHRYLLQAIEHHGKAKIS